MAFEKYYVALARKGGKNLPSVDEARRDYQDTIRRSLDGMLYAR
jgi:hypothetical protein